ncbi:MAG: YeeE/YedE family protein [Thiomicrospira sp.]|uniref:YeeE/YedE family protein n=1 Tax=Thiomicrospira sp. TaxID=935 RepID=UPI0019DDAE9B|nr:YeeE/YedE family protein [Thiomicrospira sp.]MBE0493531.1 YeeE/YedE family protein [Thiomicrospira sp.]
MNDIPSFFINYYVLAFALAFILGATAQRSNFCAVGGLRDRLTLGNGTRLWTFVAAMGVGIIISGSLEWFNVMNLSDSHPPYRTADFAWGRYIIGGFIFGLGMVLATGCGMRNTVKLGQGSYKSLWLVALMSVMAYIMTRTSFYGEWIMPIMAPLTIHLDYAGSQDLASLIFGSGSQYIDHALLVLSWAIGLSFLYFAFRNAEFRRPMPVITALIVGAIIAAAYALTGGQLGAYVMEEAAFMESPPIGLGTQSFTFAAPMGDTVNFLMSPTNLSLISFGLIAVVGVALGSFVSSLINREFKVTGFDSAKDGVISSIGALLVGFGAVLAMGCSVGHGLSGVATLALGSFVAVAAITAGALVGIKFEPLWRQKKGC